MTFRRFSLPVVALVVVASVAACGSGDSTATDDPTDATAVAGGVPASTSGSAALNAAEIEFAQGMIAHHEQAIEMAEIALDPNVGASAQVVDLATRIKGGQDPEVDLMTGWLDAAGEPVAMDLSEGHEMSSMEGMMTAEQMDALAAMTGTGFDQMWLGMMIAHHQGAIAQSEAVKASGSDAEVLALADQIIVAQQGELTEMQLLRQG